MKINVCTNWVTIKSCDTQNITHSQKEVDNKNFGFITQKLVDIPRVSSLKFVFADLLELPSCIHTKFQKNIYKGWASSFPLLFLSVWYYLSHENFCPLFVTFICGCMALEVPRDGLIFIMWIIHSPKWDWLFSLNTDTNITI